MTDASRALPDSGSTGATPPHNLYAEQVVLGSMLLSKDAIAEVEPIVGPEDYYRGAHRSLHEAITDLARRGEPADPVTVSDELDRRGWLAGIGGVVAVHDFVVRTPSAANALYYARIVADLAARRRLMETGHRLQQTAADLTVPVEDTQEQILDELKTARRDTLRVLSSDEIASLPDPEWLIEGQVPEGLTFLWGPSDTFKTFVALSMAASLASGADWFGKPVRQMPVVYVVAEGLFGFAPRMDAWRRDRSYPTKDLHVVPEPVDLMDPAQVGALAAAIRTRGAGAVVIDTWARCTPHADENDKRDQSIAIAGLDTIRRTTGASALVVHHAGKDLTKGMRGSTALHGAADAVIAVTADGRDLRLSARREAGGKMKDAPPFADWTLRVRSVALDPDREGKPRSSAVLSTVGFGNQQDAMTSILERIPDEGTEPYDGPWKITELAARFGNGDLEPIRGLIDAGKLIRIRDGGPTAIYRKPRPDEEPPPPPRHQPL